MFQFKKSFIGVAMFVSMLPMQVHASGAVAGATAITQLLNNGQLLMQVVEAKATTATVIKQLAELYKQAEREYLHLRSIGDDVVSVAKLAKEKDLNNLNKMLFLSERIHGDVNKLGVRIDTRIQEAYKKGVSIADYVKSEGDRIARKEKQAIVRVEQEQSIVESLKGDLNDISKLASDIPHSVGTQQSLGLMNTQMNKMLLSMNRIGQIIQAGQENARKAQEEADAVITEKRAKDFAAEIDKQNQLFNSSQGFLEFDGMSGKRINVQGN